MATMTNASHAYPTKMQDWDTKNLKLEDFDDINPAFLNGYLLETYNKLKAEAQPKPVEPVQIEPHYEPAIDLFAS